MKGMNTITMIALGLIFLGGIGAILLTIGQTKQARANKGEIIDLTKQENSNLKASIEILSEERDTLRKDLASQNKKIEDKNDKIIELNEALAEKSLYIQNYLTGADGFPLIDFVLYSSEDQDKTGMYALKINSKYPMYNITINIFNHDLLAVSTESRPFTDKPVITHINLDKARVIKKEFAELNPNRTEYFGERYIFREGRYHISILTRNETFVENIAIIYHGNMLHLGYKIFNSEGKSIAEHFGAQTTGDAKILLNEKIASIPIKYDFDLIE